MTDHAPGTQPGRWAAAPWVAVALAAVWIALAVHLAIAASDARKASAGSAASAREAAERAADSADAARQAADGTRQAVGEAGELARQAAGSADAARGAAGAAAASATNAEGFATAASDSADGAQQSANAAGELARQATRSVDAARGAAAAARGSAGDAAASARHAASARSESSALASAVAHYGREIQDCDYCPRMIVVPPGSFDMGSPDTERGRRGSEEPVHRVTIGAAFAVGVYEVTFDEWDACASVGGCVHRSIPYGWGRAGSPVILVSWNDAQSYVAWLSQETGEDYRLLSESEWEYVARAGAATRYWWGDDIGRNRANCDGCGSRWDGKSTAPVGSFEANPFGLHDVHGNVWEWTQDCWNESYRGAPDDGSAWKSGDCFVRVARGGSWDESPNRLRAATRYERGTANRFRDQGFRVARAFTP